MTRAHLLLMRRGALRWLPARGVNTLMSEVTRMRLTATIVNAAVISVLSLAIAFSAAEAQQRTLDIAGIEVPKGIATADLLRMFPSQLRLEYSATEDAYSIWSKDDMVGKVWLVAGKVIGVRKVFWVNDESEITETVDAAYTYFVSKTDRRSCILGSSRETFGIPRQSDYGIRVNLATKCGDYSLWSQHNFFTVTKHYLFGMFIDLN